MKTPGFFIVFIIFTSLNVSFAQIDTTKWWHDKVRNIHYKPEGKDFVLVNGKMRFNRALYGTNTGFRVEAGDLPEFALYMPGMGGNFKFGLISGNKSKWLIDADNIKTTYRPGSMLYEIRDSMLTGPRNGSINITILALADAEGMIIKTEFKNVPGQVNLFWAFGGASGKKFNRDGDIGADPESSFYLKADNCKDNLYHVNKNSFTLSYGSGKVLTEEDRYGNKPAGNKILEDNNSQKQLTGIIPPSSSLKEVDAMKQNNPFELYQSKGSATPVIAGFIEKPYPGHEVVILQTGEVYFLIQNPASKKINLVYDDLKNEFNKAESKRKELAERIIVNTPDPFINTLGSALSIAADAIWEDPTYMHGAVAWRMRLPGWRGPYVADPLGWHDRARTHFSAYANSQVTSPESGPIVADTALHLARQLEKMGTSVFSSGYISRHPNRNNVPHHYDMNLVYIDALLNHFNWTGDVEYVKKMWPVLKRHLAWETRNFDVDRDGLYDAYAAIWASDALQYSGGGVTHSSAYNYRAFKTAAEIAKKIGEDGSAHEAEANKILKAINSKLWMPEKGWYAEYKDLLGNQLLHPAAGLWTIYHSIDSKVPDPFRAYQALKYIDNYIPHIPIKANGLPKTRLYVLSTTNWQPYAWSLNNVAFGESQHTALAYWQGGRSDEAYKIWESSLVESMYLGASPGGFQQLSFYDAIRGELYRDFADGIGMAARALVEGLFGVNPDALNNTVTIKPGWPAEWGHASLKIPDVKIDFKRTGNNDSYTIIPSFQKQMNLKFFVTAINTGIKSITVNDKNISWKNVDDAIGEPVIEINSIYQKEYVIKIVWQGQPIANPILKKEYINGDRIIIQFPNTILQKVFDPQKIFLNARIKNNSLQATLNTGSNNHTAFVQVKQNGMIWWEPLDIKVKEKTQVLSPSERNINPLTIKNYSRVEKIDLSAFFNEKVTQIFKNQYLSPRPKVPTLQLPTQGIGEWTHPLIAANIDDGGLRKLAGEKNEIKLPQGISFQTPSDTSKPNIIFTSQWDNYAGQVAIPLSGKASHAYLLMAGSTNPMQSRITNGIVYISYTDGTNDSLLLKNPETWWPIEQDYYEDGYAFHSPAPKPVRIHLKTGEITSTLDNSIAKYNGKKIDGGAATVLDMPLNANKLLKEIKLVTIANDVVIGLMSLTLIR